MNKLRIKKINVNKLVIACFLVIALVLQFSFLSYLFKALTPDENKNDENVIMSYTSSGNFDYRVYLKPNEFINKEYLGPGEAYILDLVDHIQINSLYNFTATEKTNVTGTNKVVARLVAYYRESSNKSGNPEILKKENVLDEKIINFNEKKYSTIGTYDIHLTDYLQTLKEFQSKVKISVDGYLEISEETNFNGLVGGATYTDSYSNTLKIPLSSSVIKIDNNKSNAKTNKVYEGDLVKTNKTVMSYIVIANIVVFIIICILLKKLFMFTSKTEYDRELGKILKNYDDIIVNTSNILDISKYKLIEIEEFKEILNLSRELLLPIMNYEVLNGRETWFYVIKDDILYRFIISEDRLKKAKYEEKKDKKTKEHKTNNN